MKHSIFFCLLLAAGALLSAAEPGKSPTLAEELSRLAQVSRWEQQAASRFPKVTREGLSQAVELARAYMLNHQNDDGNFLYLLDLQTGRTTKRDNPVRQAGALWALALLVKERFHEPTKQAALLGFRFFSQKVRQLPNGTSCSVYPGTPLIRTGSIALYCLALMDFLENQEKILPAETARELREQLEIHLDFLRSMEREDGSWAEEYDPETNVMAPCGSPYFDGEALLAYCKAARNFQHPELLKRIDFALPKLLARYTVDCWKPGADHEETKGFYQWACMAFAEYLDAGFPQHAQLVTDAAMTLTWWQLYENDLLHRTGNTAYAVEGLVAAWRIANARGLTAEAEKIRAAVFSVMNRLAPLQFLGPYMQYNPDLDSLKKAPPLAAGGIVGEYGDYEVRIDVVQHQIHAMLLILKYMMPL